MRRASMHSLLFSAPESLHGYQDFPDCDAKVVYLFDNEQITLFLPFTTHALSNQAQTSFYQKKF